MVSFQTIVLIIAVVILIISLAAIGTAIYLNRFTKAYPPVISQCPNTYTAGKNGLCTPSTGSSDPSININNSRYTGVDGLCQKWLFAQQNKLIWPGVTDSTNPCNNE